MRKGLIRLLPLLLAVLLTSCTGRTKEIRSYREEGIKAMAEENYPAAVDAFRHAMAFYGTARQDGTGIDILRYLCEAEMKTGDYASAVGTLEKLIETDKKRQVYLDMKAVCLARGGGSLEEALACYREAGETGGSSESHRDALFSIGEVLAGSGDETMKAAALELYREAEEKEGQSPALSLWIGKLLFEGGETEAALQSFRDGEALADSVLAEENAGEEKVAEAQELREHLLFNQAVCLEHLEQYEEAAGILEAVKNEYGETEALLHELQFLSTRGK